MRTVHGAEDNNFDARVWGHEVLKLRSISEPVSVRIARVGKHKRDMCDEASRSVHAAPTSAATTRMKSRDQVDRAM